MTPAASAAPDAGAARRTAEAVWRIESARLIAGLARLTGDVGLAEDLAQDALVAALEQWPATGVPDNPGAWLTAVARRRYVDGVRRQAVFDRKAEQIGRELAEAEDPMDEIEFDAHVEDDVLRLIFTACHPVLSRDARVALTLKLVAGLSTEQIARAFLVSTPTMAARVTRAKKALGDGAGAVRGTGRRGTRGPARVRPRGRLPDLQRGLRGDLWRVLDAGRPVRGGDAAGPDARRARA